MELQRSLFAATLLDQPGVPKANIKWRPPDTLPNLSQHQWIWMDTETTGKNIYYDKPVGMSGWTYDQKGWYLPWGHAGGGNLDERKIKNWAKRELRNKDIVFHDGKFDNHMLYNWGIDLEAQGCRVHAVAFQAALLDENRRRFNLEQMGQDILGEGKDTSIFKDEKAHIAEMPAGMVGPYAIIDARRVYQLDMACRFGIDSKLRNSIKSDDLERVLDLEDSVIFAVCEMERNGAIIDVAKAERWNKELDQLYTNLITDISRDVNFRINPDSATDMSRLFRYLGLEAPVTEQGAESFEAPFLETVQNVTVQKALRARRYRSLQNKYIKAFLKNVDSNNVIRYILHQLRATEENKGTISGRFSSAKPQSGGINCQQVAKPDKQAKKFGSWEFIIRELFIPEKGKHWVSFDASQIEFRLFAHYSNSDKLIKAYTDNPWIDFHQMVTDMIQRIKPDFIRSLAKNVNFAKVYGAGRDKISDQLGLPRRESDKFVDAYEEEFPEVPKLLRSTTRLAEQRHYVRTIMGRRARFNQPSSDDPKTRKMEEIMYKPHSALNKVLQGTAADIMKFKIKVVHDHRKELELTERLTIHDEGDGDMVNPEKCKLLDEILNEQSFPIKVPILWEMNVAPNWAVHKSESFKWDPHQHKLVPCLQER